MVDFAPKVAIACQGGGTHAAFEAGVLTADSDPSRTVIPAHRGQRSGDCGQFPISA